MNKFLTRYLLGISVFIALNACNNSKENTQPLAEGAKSFEFKGNLKNLSQEGYLLLSGLNLEEQKWIKIDSVKISANGDFKFDVKNSIPEFYLLRINDTLSQSFIADNAEIEFSADIKEFEQTKEFQYSKANSSLFEFTKSILPHTKELQKISKTVNTLIQQGKFDSVNVFQKNFESEQAKIKTIAKEFIRQNNASIAIFALIDHFNFEQDYDFLDSLNQKMTKELPNSKYTKMLSSQFEKIQAYKAQKATANNIGIGSLAPDFELQTPSGEKIKCSSFRGKYLLLDFWASWCKPCRAENPNVVNAYKKYSNKNFAILSVSLDQEKEAWLKAIETDKMTWNHASDLGGWESAVVPLYNLESIPATYLIDKEGKIIATQLRGEALENKLAEILK
ncbi:MAG: AhpC/TSA family protein [Cytophagales bacterium]|nr:MAG: AhpC/TSA family protein [Cytophagales bacterium]